MNGITILSTIHTQTPGIKGSALFTLIAGSVLLAISFCSLIFEDGFDDTKLITFAICLIICIVSGLAVNLIDDEQYVYATISSETSINEIIDKYEIMEIDGELYKLKIIEKEEN